MANKEQIKELAEKHYGIDPHKFGGQRDGFKEGYKQAQFDLISYIENNAEIAIPINDLMPEGRHLSKKEYGLVLLKYLVKELNEGCL